MANIIPPLLSSTPPPITGPLDEDEEDEFGDFRAATDSYNFDDSSLPSSPQKSPERCLFSDLPQVNLDINSNKSKTHQKAEEMPNEELVCTENNKDCLDRRKNSLDHSDTQEDANNCETPTSSNEITEAEIISEIIDENIITEFKATICDLNDSENKEDVPHLINNEFFHHTALPVDDDNESSKGTKQPEISETPEVQSNEEVESAEGEVEQLQNNLSASYDQEIRADQESACRNSDDADPQTESSMSIRGCETDPNESDDEFGDFENHVSKDKLPENGLHEFEAPKKDDSDFGSPTEDCSDCKSVTNDDDGLGDFESPASDSEDFGDFESSDNNADLKSATKDDVFGDFESPKSEDCGENSTKKGDDFGGFKSPAKVEVNFGGDFKSGKNDADDFGHFESPAKDDDNFGDFASLTNVGGEFGSAAKDGDDFGDFESPTEYGGDFEGFESPESKPEDFGEFSQFATAMEDTDQSLFDMDEKDVFSRTESILKEMFPVSEEINDQCEFVDQAMDNFIFHELKDVADTNALVYQWSKSNSQKMFLKSLNIDMRNILYGPTWNSAMPRFASNLGLTPLEPVKSEILTPTPAPPVQTAISLGSTQPEIPTAQFDWGGSGLINPLDSATSKEPPIKRLPDNFTPSQVNTDLLSSNLSAKLPPAPSTTPLNRHLPKPDQPTSDFQTPVPLNDEELFNDFSPFQTPKMVPLRETHISNEPTDAKPGWLQPTLLTPDLPRKEPIASNQDDEEFDDFQMGAPVGKAEIKDSSGEFDVGEEQSQKHIAKAPTPVSVEAQINNRPKEKHVNFVSNDDEEFSDFHSSVPQIQMLKPVQLEPLKPVVQHLVAPSTHINWPDPGVTDDDIRNIELSFSRKSGKTKEEEEWSDFISVSNPMRSGMPDRTATPDLPLSVLNLQQVQPPKQPIPVITPSGLVQTKLSSYTNVTQSTQPGMTMLKPQPNQIHPSLISNQFANHLKESAPNNGVPSQDSDDDDSWSDFVSSQPPPQTNGFQQKPKSVQNWTNATPNIIMNPTHTFQGYPSPKLSHPGRSAIPSISAMPDLDFIAPKSRTNKK